MCAFSTGKNCCLGVGVSKLYYLCNYDSHGPPATIFYSFYIVYVSINRSTGEEKWDPDMEIGMDWKSLVRSGLLPVTTDVGLKKFNFYQIY